MHRYASVIGLKAEHRVEYERLHSTVWLEVLKQIYDSNIRNYSIFRYGELLFAYFEYVGVDFKGDMAQMAEDPTTQQWWDLCKPLQTPVADRQDGEWWSNIPEIFHVD